MVGCRKRAMTGVKWDSGLLDEGPLHAPLCMFFFLVQCVLRHLFKLSKTDADDFTNAGS